MPRDEELQEQHEEAKANIRTSINLARGGVPYDDIDADIDRAYVAFDAYLVQHLSQRVRDAYQGYIDMANNQDMAHVALAGWLAMVADDYLAFQEQGKTVK